MNYLFAVISVVVAGLVAVGLGVAAGALGVVGVGVGVGVGVVAHFRLADVALSYWLLRLEVLLEILARCVRQQLRNTRQIT